MDIDQLIADYLSNTLSLEAQQQFDHLMATDSEFVKEVTFQENLKTVIKKEEQEQVKSQLQSFDSNDKTTSKSYIKWLVAASIIALLAIPSFIYFGQTNVTNEELFATHFEPYKNVVHPIVRGEDSLDLKTKAFIAYNANQYEEALVHFNTILKENADSEISFYKANVLLQLGNFDDAITILLNNKNLSENLIDRQQWYLALAYVRTGNDKAITILKDLINKSDYKKEAAQKLLEQLD